MAFRKRALKRRQLKRKSRRVSRRRISSIPNFHTMPRKLWFDFHYQAPQVGLAQPVAALGISTLGTYNANSIYQPDTTFLSTSCAMFDELMAIYDRFKVYACTMDVDMWNVNAYPVEVLTYIAPVLSGGTPADLSDQTRYDWTAMSSRFRSKVVTLSGSNFAGYRKRVVKKFFFPPLVDDYTTSVNYQGNATNNPASLIKAVIMACPMDSSGHAQIEYTIRFTFHTLLSVTDMAFTTKLD